MRRLKSMIISAVSVAVPLLAISCASVKEIPADLTSAQLIQQGQNAYSSSNYSLAEKYYETVIQRYGNNTATYIEAKYELGHLYIKTKNYQKAYQAFDEILEIYSYAAIGDLPPAYRKLAQIGMDKIPEKKLEEFRGGQENVQSDVNTADAQSE